MRKLAILGLAALFAACADTPTQPAADLDVGPLANLTIVGNVQTHDFNELLENCTPGATLPYVFEDPYYVYEGLHFLTTPYLAPCLTYSPNGTTVVTPAHPDYSSEGSDPFELKFDLENPATAVSIESYDGVGALFPPVLNAYNAAGVLVGAASDATVGAWVTLSVTGDISQVGLLMPQGYHFLDNLTITYVGSEPEPDEPESKADCKDGKWKSYPQQFKNQGQCIRFVEGKESRP